MKQSHRSAAALASLAAAVLTGLPASAQTGFDARLQGSLATITQAKPYQDNNGQLPPADQYRGPLFRLSRDWPNRALPPIGNAPWQRAINNGRLTPANAPAYAEALRQAISANARQLVLHYESWDAAKAGWYNEPWLGSQREAIHGTYPAGEFGPGIFPGTGLQATFQTHVLTYYDARAAYTLRKVWGSSSLSPDVSSSTTPFDEGALIVKAALFSSEDSSKPTDWWASLRGAATWPLFIPVAAQGGTQPPPRVWPGYLAQFDIIVKDSQSSPTTGWVFMTLVYDPNAPGDAWDKMIPLGVSWGNDPGATREGMPLGENWINPRAPLYATQTLGWGGRLSGPNDGARNDIVVGGQLVKNAADSSCMSCHSTAQWNVAGHRMPTFLLPSIPTGPDLFDYKMCQVGGKSYPCSPAPGSSAWMKWFQNRPGTQPMDPGNVAGDFDLVLSFKSLRLWAGWKYGAKALPELLARPGRPIRYNQYNGAPLPPAH